MIPRYSVCLGLVWVFSFSFFFFKFSSWHKQLGDLKVWVRFIDTRLKKEILESSLAAERVKDPAWPLLRHGFDPRPENFCMPWAQPKKFFLERSLRHPNGGDK